MSRSDGMEAAAGVMELALVLLAVIGVIAALIVILNKTERRR